MRFLFKIQYSLFLQKAATEKTPTKNHIVILNGEQSLSPPGILYIMEQEPVFKHILNIWRALYDQCMS